MWLDQDFHFTICYWLSRKYTSLSHKQDNEILGGGAYHRVFSACLAFPDLCRGWQMLQVDPSPRRREKGALTHRPRESLTRKLHPTEIWRQAEASKQRRQFVSYPEHEGPNSIGATSIPIRAARWSSTHLKLATPRAKLLILHLALKYLFIFERNLRAAARDDCWREPLSFLRGGISDANDHLSAHVSSRCTPAALSGSGRLSDTPGCWQGASAPWLWGEFGPVCLSTFSLKGQVENSLHALYVWK